MKRVVVSDEAVRIAGARSTEASYRISGREVPASHVRTAAAQRYLDGFASPRKFRQAVDTSAEESELE
jgi:hypothetical protein